MLKRVVFLDRDGVINRDSFDYIKSVREFEFIPGSLQAIKRLTAQGINVILITNQSAVNRGIITLETLKKIHGFLCAQVLSQGGKLKDILIITDFGEGYDNHPKKPRLKGYVTNYHDI